MSPELIIIVPVYNEEASIGKVVLEWIEEIERLTPDFLFLLIDDGSTDRSLAVIEAMRSKLGTRLEIISRENRGHGQTCLQGYRIACKRGIPYVLQIDSDGQCDPRYFPSLWALRDRFNIIYGYRKNRDDGWQRVMASMILKIVLLMTSGVYCIDANVPYRLMQTKVLPRYLSCIPGDFFLCNVALAVLLRRKYDITHTAVPIRFRARYGGEPSVPLRKFLYKAIELISQLRHIG